MPEANSMAENACKYKRIILQKKCTIADDCAICIDSVLEKPVMYLPCKHFFHQACLNQAIEKKLYTCPLCRHDLVEALLKTNFKFPMGYNPYIGLSWTFTRDTYDTYTRDTYTRDTYTRDTYTRDTYTRDTYDDTYTRDTYDDTYDDMPELIDDDSDDLTLWSGLLFNIMQDHSLGNEVPIMNVPNAVPLVNVPNASSITVDYTPSQYELSVGQQSFIEFIVLNL
jgi:hypothetical protein